jgi:hypothetical protein
MLVENATVIHFFFRPVFTFRPYGTGDERGWRVFYQHPIPNGMAVENFELANAIPSPAGTTLD